MTRPKIEDMNSVAPVSMVHAPDSHKSRSQVSDILLDEGRRLYLITININFRKVTHNEPFPLLALVSVQFKRRQNVCPCSSCGVETLQRVVGFRVFRGGTPVRSGYVVF